MNHRPTIEGGLDSQSEQARISEDSLIGCIVLDPSVLDRLDGMLGALFSIPEFGSLFDLLSDLRKGGKPIGDVSCLLSELRAAGMLEKIGGAARLAKWASTSIAHNAAYYAEVIRRLATVRSMRIRLQRALLDLSANDPNPTRIAEQLDANLSAIRTNAEGDESFTFLQLAHSALEDCLSDTVGANTIPFGLSRLDAITGGLFPSEITILAARPSIGKTALGFGIALNAAKRDKKLLFVSCEMNRIQLGQRMLSLETGIPPNRIRNAYLNSDEKQRLRDALPSIQNLLGKAWIASRPTVDSIRARARLAMSQDGLDFVVVDYLGLLRAIDQRAKPYEQVTQLSRDLKSLAIEINKPILVLAQLNREAGKSDDAPKLEHLRDSGAIEQDADNVLFIHRQRGKSETKLILAKQRQGEVGSIDIVFDSDRCCFADVPDDFSNFR